jgi:hypothetical protein
MTLLARYTQYLFNLQHNISKIGMQQRMHLTAYKESPTAATREMERLRHENVILHSGAHPPLEQGRELQEVYHRLCNAEHGWNHTRMLLDITHEEVDRAEMIANLAQQLLELQVKAPPKPTEPEEIDAMSGVDDD